MSAFAAVFVNYTPAISDTVFKQVDPTHWVRDALMMGTLSF